MKNEEKFTRSTGRELAFQGLRKWSLRQEQPGGLGNGWNIESKKRLVGDEAKEVSRSQDQELQLCSSKITLAGRGIPMADQKKGIQGGVEFLLEVSVTVDKS